MNAVKVARTRAWAELIRRFRGPRPNGGNRHIKSLFDNGQHPEWMLLGRVPKGSGIFSRLIETCRELVKHGTLFRGPQTSHIYSRQETEECAEEKTEANVARFVAAIAQWAAIDYWRDHFGDGHDARDLIVSGSLKDCFGGKNEFISLYPQGAREEVKKIWEEAEAIINDSSATGAIWQLASAEVVRRGAETIRRDINASDDHKINIHAAVVSASDRIIIIDSNIQDMPGAYEQLKREWKTEAVFTGVSESELVRMAEDQNPYSLEGIKEVEIIIGCSDSRASPQNYIREEKGILRVYINTIAAFVPDEAVGEFIPDALIKKINEKNVLVRVKGMSHKDCGGAKAAVDETCPKTGYRPHREKNPLAYWVGRYDRLAEDASRQTASGKQYRALLNIERALLNAERYKKDTNGEAFPQAVSEVRQALLDIKRDNSERFATVISEVEQTLLDAEGGNKSELAGAIARTRVSVANFTAEEVAKVSVENVSRYLRKKEVKNIGDAFAKIDGNAIAEHYPLPKKLAHFLAALGWDRTRFKAAEQFHEAECGCGQEHDDVSADPKKKLSFLELVKKHNAAVANHTCVLQ